MSTDFEEASVFDRKYEGAELEAVIRAMKLLSTDKESAEETLKGINKEYDYLRLSLIPKLFEDRGVSNMTMPEIGRVQLAADIYASIPADRREEAYQWLDDNGFGDLITNTVNASTLKAFLKRRVVAGEEIPDGLFKVTPFTRASITKV